MKGADDAALCVSVPGRGADCCGPRLIRGCWSRHADLLDSVRHRDRAVHYPFREWAPHATRDLNLIDSEVAVSGYRGARPRYRLMGMLFPISDDDSFAAMSGERVTRKQSTSLVATSPRNSAERRASGGRVN